MKVQLAEKRMLEFRIDQLPKKTPTVYKHFLEIQLSINEERISCRMLKKVSVIIVGTLLKPC